jgi:uncharacterized protein
MMDIEKFKIRAEKSASGNKMYLDKLKQYNQRKLDEVFQTQHEQVFETVDCLSCANCCKTTSPVFYQKDIERAAKAIRMKPGDFIEKYLVMDTDGDYVLQTAPCPFLAYDNYCLIYQDRPTACREYPHTNRKKVYQLLDLTYKNTFVCPAVLQIVEQIKTKIKF